MSSSCLMGVYVGGISHPYRYFHHRHEACCHVKEVDKGKEVHEDIIDKGLIARKTCCIVLSNALVDNALH